MNSSLVAVISAVFIPKFSAVAQSVSTVPGSS